MIDDIFKIIFFAGLILGSAIRATYGRGHRRKTTAVERKEGLAVWSLMSLWGCAQIAAICYVFTHWLDFADYHPPTWIGWVGAAVFAAALWLLWRSHADLGRNWAPTLEISEGHTLVTHGVYRSIRHPMYAAHLLWGIAQAMLLQNWIAGVPALAVFVPLYLLRVPHEEQLMLDHFGEEYRLYMNRTGRLMPRFRDRKKPV
jgi:protein-S-isoprenylcysteine O-methyltransferase Ste14